MPERSAPGSAQRPGGLDRRVSEADAQPETSFWKNPKAWLGLEVPQASTSSGQQKRQGQSPMQSQSGPPGAAGARSMSQEQALPSAASQDTTIGRGFSAQLKRGVAQASPDGKRPGMEEIVQQKDGGFVQTMQRGFEGIFGHLATSKEEVLRRRGPQLASEYEAVPGDEIDNQVRFFAKKMPPQLAGVLRIYRFQKGEYEIGGEKVRLDWHSWVRNTDGFRCKEVFVFNQFEVDENGQPTMEPLPLYLQHSANVQYNLQHVNPVQQVPDDHRLSFAEVKGTPLMSSDSDARFSAMALAVEHAKLREEHALNYRRASKEKVPEGTDMPANQQWANRDMERTKSHLISAPGREAFGGPAAAAAPDPSRQEHQMLGSPPVLLGGPMWRDPAGLGLGLAGGPGRPPASMFPSGFAPVGPGPAGSCCSGQRSYAPVPGPRPPVSMPAGFAR